MTRLRDAMAGASGILSYFTRHATAANLLLIVLIAAGLFALPRMRAQYFPDVIIEEISLTVRWEGAGAADVDRAIVQPLEPALSAVEGVTSLRARSQEGIARLFLEFEPGWDLGRAMDEVKAAVDSVTDLPEDAETPEIIRAAWRDRVADVVISGPLGEEQLARLADEFMARAWAEGVTRISVQGLAGTEIRVEVPMAQLIRHGLTLSDIAARIRAETQPDPAGTLSDGSARLRSGTERRSADSVAGIVVMTLPDGARVTLGDIADIRHVGATESRRFMVGDNPAVTLRVDRSAEGDAIEIHSRIESIAEAMRPELPAGAKIDLIRVRTNDIIARLNILAENGAFGLALVLGLLFLFLNARTALWVAAGIPVAMLTTVALMYAFGLTLNMISLFALILTLGIVVDDAIVVGEHADFRFRRRGEGPVEAAENAVRRMAAPVFSSTITTIIAFLGLTAISGRFGDLISDIPFTVAVVLAASLIECFLILPNHMSHALAHAGQGRWYDAPSRVSNRALGWFRDRLMRPMTEAVMAARYPVLAAAILALAVCVAMFLRGDVTWRFFNAPERPTITANFAMVDGASRDDTARMLADLQAAIDDLARQYREQYGVEPLNHVLGQIGANFWPELAVAETKDNDLLGGVAIELVDPDLRPWSASQFISDLQEAAPRHPLLEELSFRSWRHGPGGGSLEVDLTGAEPDVLKEAAESLKRELAGYPEVSGLEDSLPFDKVELVLELTPLGRHLGFTAEALGAELRNRLTGIEAATFPEGTRSAAIRVELPASDLTADFLDRTMLPTAQGHPVPLSDIVRVTMRQGFSTIRREQGQAVVTVSGELSEDDPARAEAIRKALELQILPRLTEEHGVGWRLSGLAEQETRFLGDAMIGFGAALAGIYAVLAWIFASWTRPLVVMSVIPLGLVGAIWGHWWWDVPLSMFSVVGLIGMSGIIINDAIVLISTIDEKARIRALRPAIVEGVAERLRPVLLTTLTTVLGLAPLLFETSRQAQFLKPTVITLCYGLAFGMVLVLVVIPALMVVQRDIGLAARGLRRALRVRRLRGILFIVGVGLAGAFAAIMGSALISGGGWSTAFALFVAAVVAIVSIAAVFAAFMRARHGA
ncbi:multidrug efflux pump subunit AcrB [Albidovulum inexpectatum]|uniref:Multidrug efflux pump subunit AcrB n=1 Tax=Albidovulum inexpectatum TaxID=196587 RepID=A0A2S5JHT7_9RHOB|nr:efflux RND transporter permease subunit [Albidovulum inexpectatum]PPB81077.1 multidrug efflux pump subunit AcrB [Albidovulum inexpectatum]